MRQLAVILLSLIAFNAVSQGVGEKVIFSPDRNLYISGEQIRFSAMIRPENDSVEVSRILYCELITADGRRIAGGKYAAENSLVSGSLVIPEDIITGVYYLKAYTRSMRNEGPSSYSYDYIRVINPQRDEVLSGRKGDSTTIDADTLCAVKERIINRCVFRRYSKA